MGLYMLPVATPRGGRQFDDGLPLCEGTALENVCSNLIQMFNRITKAEFSTSAVLLPNCLLATVNSFLQLKV